MSDLDPNSGIFSDQIQTYGEPKCTKSDLKKSSGFVPFGANLTHFVPKSGDPGAVANTDARCLVTFDR